MDKNTKPISFSSMESSLSHAYLNERPVKTAQYRLISRRKLMTSRERSQRNPLRIHCIDTVLAAYHLRKPWANSLDIQLASSCVSIEGRVPSHIHRDALLPAIRQAGVLAEVANRVQVNSCPLKRLAAQPPSNFS